MIRRVLVAGVAVLGAAVLADGWLGRRTGSGGPGVPLRSEVLIRAPIERVWAIVSDIPGQPRWMHEMKAVRILTAGPVGVGTRGEADVRILGLGVTDPVVVTEWDPPRRFAIRHEGRFTGEGTIDLEPAGDDWTNVRWDERLLPPVFPNLGSLVQSPILGAIFQADLERLRELVERTG